MIPEINIISRKASIVSTNRAGGSGGQSPLRKFIGFKEHLDWFKIGLNAAKIIAVQDYKRTKN